MNEANRSRLYHCHHCGSPNLMRERREIFAETGVRVRITLSCGHVFDERDLLLAETAPTVDFEYERARVYCQKCQSRQTVLEASEADPPGGYNTVTLACGHRIAYVEAVLGTPPGQRMPDGPGSFRTPNGSSVRFNIVKGRDGARDGEVRFRFDSSNSPRPGPDPIFDHPGASSPHATREAFRRFERMKQNTRYRANPYQGAAGARFTESPGQVPEPIRQLRRCKEKSEARDLMRVLAKRYHPDQNPGADPELFKAIVAEYQIISGKWSRDVRAQTRATQKDEDHD